LRTIGLSPEQLARVLLAWSAEGKVPKQGTRIRGVLPHEQLAEFILTTRETVTRTLNEFKDRELVAVRGSTRMVANREVLESSYGVQRSVTALLLGKNDKTSSKNH
jgi:CRP/FNR family transcriptional regulator